MALSLVIVAILIILLCFTVFGLYQKNNNVLCKSKKRLDGKTAIITGGTTGMGLEIAVDFAGRGAKVIIACPFKNEGETAKKYIEAPTENADITYKHLDLASLDSVRAFAADILKTEDRLDILMNNAGVGIPGDFETADNMNFIMQVNYFGHFLLTLLLLPLLRKTGTHNEPARIVNTASCLHRIGRVNLHILNRTGYFWSKIQIYGNSKICLVMFARELTKRLKTVQANVVINSLDPGAVGTRIFDACGNLRGELITFFYRYFCKSPYEGAQTAIHVALDTKAGEVSGQFFKDCTLYQAARRAYDDKTATQVWEESVRLVKLTVEEVEDAFTKEIEKLQVDQ